MPTSFSSRASDPGARVEPVGDHRRVALLLAGDDGAPLVLPRRDLDVDAALVAGQPLLHEAEIALLHAGGDPHGREIGHRHQRHAEIVAELAGRAREIDHPARDGRGDGDRRAEAARAAAEHAEPELGPLKLLAREIALGLRLLDVALGADAVLAEV